MAKLIIPFINRDFRIPLITFCLGGKTLVAMVDTGSESTLFNQCISENEDFVTTGTNYVMSLVGLSGATAQNRIFIAKATLEVYNQQGKSFTVPVEGMLSDLSGVSKCIGERIGKDITVSAIIGSDYLARYMTEIDYKRKRLSIFVKTIDTK